MLKSVPWIEGVEVFRVEQGGVAAKGAEFGAGAEELKVVSGSFCLLSPPRQHAIAI